MPNTLANRIPTTLLITKRANQIWDTVIPHLTNSVTNTSIAPGIARRYKNDFYGVLAAIGIDRRFWYPHLIVNGYTTPVAYPGDLYTIKRIDTPLLLKYENSVYGV